MRELWRRERDGVLYQLRRRGRTLSLFANGVQHSEFHPDRWVTGSVWDLLWLPALFHEPEQYRRILVLGLGGGSLVPPLAGLVQPDTFVGVDNDPAHLEIAEQFFRVGDFGVDTELANARDWVRDWQGEPFDLVIEDLFAPSSETVSRVLPADRNWCRSLKKLVAPGGTLVMNFGDWREYSHSWAASHSARAGWRRGFRLSTPDCHNAVIAWLHREASSSELRARVRSWSELDRALNRGRLDYGIRRLF